MRYWCFVTRPANWQVCRAQRIFGFEYGYAKTLATFMDKGDKAVVYLTQKTGFVATVEISRKGRFDPELARNTKWDRFYPYIAEIVVEREGFVPVSSTVSKGKDGVAVPIATRNTILNDVEFITDSGAGSKGNARWNLFLYPSMMRIPELDYMVISRAIETQARGQLFA